MSYRDLRYRLAGPMAPLPVIYKDDLSIDHHALAKYVDWLMNEGLTNVCFTFTFSQMDFITTEELIALHQTVAEAVNGRGTFVGCTAGGPALECIKIVEQIKQAGADTVMVHQPEWVMQNGGTAGVMMDYLKTVLDSTDFPIMNCLLPEAWNAALPLLTTDHFEQLVEHDNYIGFKDDIYQVPGRMSVVQKFGDRIAIVGGGNMQQYLLFHRYPCQGEFAGHFCPQWALKLFKHLDDNDYVAALDMIDGYAKVAWAPAGMHWLAGCHVRYFGMGFAEGYAMRPPLTAATPEQAQAVIDHMRKNPDMFAPVTQDAIVGSTA